MYIKFSVTVPLGQFISREAALSVRPSVRLSVTSMLCEETKKHTADILIPYERVVTLGFKYQQRLVNDVLFDLKIALKVTHPL